MESSWDIEGRKLWYTFLLSLGPCLFLTKAYKLCSFIIRYCVLWFNFIHSPNETNATEAFPDFWCNGLLELHVLLCPTDLQSHLSLPPQKAPRTSLLLEVAHREPWHCGVDGKKLYFRINIILCISFHPLKNFKLDLLKPHHFLLDRN